MVIASAGRHQEQEHPDDDRQARRPWRGGASAIALDGLHHQHEGEDQERQHERRQDFAERVAVDDAEHAARSNDSTDGPEESAAARRSGRCGRRGGGRARGRRRWTAGGRGRDRRPQNIHRGVLNGIFVVSDNVCYVNLRIVNRKTRRQAAGRTARRPPSGAATPAAGLPERLSAPSRGSCRYGCAEFGEDPLERLDDLLLLDRSLPELELHRERLGRRPVVEDVRRVGLTGPWRPRSSPSHAARIRAWRARTQSARPARSFSVGSDCLTISRSNDLEEMSASRQRFRTSSGIFVSDSDSVIDVRDLPSFFASSSWV